MFNKLFFVLLITLTLVSCGTATILTPTASPALTNTPKPPPTATPTNPPPTRVPIPERPNYKLTTLIDYDRHSVSVEEAITYPNHTGETLNTLTLAVAPNLWPNCFRLENITLGNTPVTNYTLDGHRLDIALPNPLLPNYATTLTLQYSLALPYLDQRNSYRARIFGYGDLQTNLTNWYPFVVPYLDGEWIIHEPWSHGEYLVYPLADFTVDLEFVNLENAPVVAASGAPEPHGNSMRYTLTGGRAFALSASRNFEVRSLQVGEVKISSYYFPIYKRGGEGALIASKQALEVFSERFGPYPHKTLSLVVADFMDSMEFSALYFNSRYFYDQFDGSPQNYLTSVSVHETAHQWWFEAVANDQALEPWLDESLSTYSELIFYESMYPDLVPWWWSYRVNFFNPSGKIDIPVYQGLNDENYKRIVYFNGTHFLRDLRARIGDEAFFAFLQVYFTQTSDGIATKDDFFTILDAHTEVDYSDIFWGYFRAR